MTIPVSPCSLRGRSTTMRNLRMRIDDRFFIPVTADAVFSGITTFAKLPWVQCLTKEKHVPFDIAFLGAPFVSLTLKKDTFYSFPPPRSAQTVDGLSFVLHRTPARRTGRVPGSDLLGYARDRAA